MLNDPSAGSLLRDITQGERAAFARNGVVKLRQVIPAPWIAALRQAVSAVMADADQSAQNYTPDDQPRFFSQAFARFVDPVLDAWALHGPTKHIAAQIHPGVRRLRFFYDQVFVQEPGARVGAPYHQDFPYLPITGEQYFRIWVPLDTVTADSGALRYLKGSHRGPLYRPRSFSGNAKVAEIYASSPYPDLPDFDDHPSSRWFIGEAEPGDALLHHPKTVHGSPPNTTRRHRRAVTTIFIGDDVVWDPRPGTAFDHIGRVGAFDVPAMPAGHPVDDDLFPLVDLVNTTRRSIRERGESVIVSCAHSDRASARRPSRCPTMPC